MIVVEPVRLTYAGEPFEAELRTEDVLASLWQRSAWAVITPGELAWRKSDSDEVLLTHTTSYSAPRSSTSNHGASASLATEIALHEETGVSATSGEQGGHVDVYVAEVRVALTRRAQGATDRRARDRRAAARSLSPSTPTNDPRRSYASSSLRALVAELVRGLP